MDVTHPENLRAGCRYKVWNSTIYKGQKLAWDHEVIFHSLQHDKFRRQMVCVFVHRDGSIALCEPFYRFDKVETLEPSIHGG